MKGSSVCDPGLAAIFTPRHPTLGRYEVCTTADPLAGVRAAGAADGIEYSPVAQVEALDAFGRAGSYDRARLAQLYGGRRVEVARGWHTGHGVFEAVTLLSPYPDASLAHLHAGTMVIRLTIDRGL